MTKLKTVFFGTPDFSLPTLELLSNHDLVDLAYVVTMPDRKAGRGQKLTAPPVAQYALQNSLPLFQTPNINKEEEFLNKLEELKPDVFIVLAFAQFLGARILNMPSRGCYNIHTSLLPKYRGAAPIQYAIMNGDKTTGVSIQKMVKKMDAGDIVYSKPVPISETETGEELYNKLKVEASLCLNSFLLDLSKGEIEEIPQNEGQVSFAPTITKEMGRLNFIEKTAEEIFNLVRAFTPWPGTFVDFGNKRLKIKLMTIEGPTLSPGEAIIKSSGFFIGCKSGTISLKQVQLEGKKETDIFTFLNGIQNKSNLTLNGQKIRSTV